MIEVIEDGDVNGDKFLQTSHSSKAGHLPFSSSERKMRILDPVVQVTAGSLFVPVSDFSHRGRVGPQSVCDDKLGLAVSLHCFLQEFKGITLVPTFGNIAF